MTIKTIFILLLCVGTVAFAIIMYNLFKMTYEDYLDNKSLNIKNKPQCEALYSEDAE